MHDRAYVRTGRSCEGLHPHGTENGQRGFRRYAVPGAYFWIGHDGSMPVHNPGYILDDKILPIGASMFARIIETRMPAGGRA